MRVARTFLTSARESARLLQPYFAQTSIRLIDYEIKLRDFVTALMQQDVKLLDELAAVPLETYLLPMNDQFPAFAASLDNALLAAANAATNVGQALMLREAACSETEATACSSLTQQLATSAAHVQQSEQAYTTLKTVLQTVKDFLQATDNVLAAGYPQGMS